MLTRILTSLVGLAVFFAAVFAPVGVLAGAVAIITLLMLHEIYGAMDTKRELRYTGFLACVIMFASALASRPLVAFYGAIILFMAVMILLHGRAKCTDVLETAAITVFVSAAMLSLMLIRSKFGVYAFILPFIVAWLTDTGAYFAGSMLGKHKLAPHISPKKTIEGSIGGIILATVATVIFCKTLQVSEANIFSLAMFGIIGSIVSQAGDLAASCIKRDFGKKEYGTVLPGHGGMTDRFDSVLFAAPFVYFVLQLLGI